MFLIKFNGYKKEKEECTGLFFAGCTYACSVVDSGRYYQVQDENGKVVKFTSMIHDRYYDFSRLEPDEDKFVSSIDTRDGEMKYQMNGIDVTKSFFDDKLLEVELLKSKGASVFIDFEVSFE